MVKFRQAVCKISFHKLSVRDHDTHGQPQNRQPLAARRRRKHITYHRFSIAQQHLASNMTYNN